MRSTQIIVFASSTGGCGKSSTALNLAAFIADENPFSRVLLLDGNIAYGNLSLVLGNKLAPNMLDLLNFCDSLSARSKTNISWTQLSTYLLTHSTRTNLDLLANPDNPDVLQEIQSQDYSMMIKLFSRHYTHIVIDTASGLKNEDTQEWVKFAHKIIIPSYPCINSLYQSNKDFKRIVKLNKKPIKDLFSLNIDFGLDKDINPKKVAPQIHSFLAPSNFVFFKNHQGTIIKSLNSGTFNIDEVPSYRKDIKRLYKAINL